MKTIVILVIAAGLGAAGSYWLVSQRAETRLAQERTALESKWEVEKVHLEQEIKNAKMRPVKSDRPLPAALAPAAPIAGKSPEQILARLKELRVSGKSASRAQAVRQVIYHLQALSEGGENSLPVIREFLGRFEDVSYTPELLEDTASGTSTKRPVLPGTPAQSTVQLDFVLPPSLRLGLVDVLKEIGGPSAEGILAEMLGSTGRAVELAYVAHALQELAPDRYKEVAVSAAKDLLANPSSAKGGDRLDENAKGYLYYVLAMYNDPAVANVAQALLINAEGHLDRKALAYVAGNLKEMAVPALYQAFNDPRLTNLWEKATLAGQALAYAGKNPQADELFKTMVANESAPSWMRAMTIQTLAGNTFFGGTTPSNPAEIQARIGLINSLPETADPALAKAKTEALQRLNNHLNGETPAAPESEPAAAEPVKSDSGVTLPGAK